MTLLITILAAVIATIIWYRKAPQDTMKISTLCFLFWGASLMWMVDAFYEFIELKAAFFTPSVEDMLNDTFLGLSIVTLGLMIWIVRLLVNDPQGKIGATLNKRQENHHV